MRNRMILAAGILGVASLVGVAGGQETQPAPVFFRSDVRMVVYVCVDGSDIPRELGRATR